MNYIFRNIKIIYHKYIKQQKIKLIKFQVCLSEYLHFNIEETKK